MTAQTTWFNRASGLEGLWLALAALTIFLGAFLLFQVELLMAKLILPWFGGSAAVWLACLMFFQLTLLVGYLYAHLLAGRIPPMWRTRLHIALLLLSLLFLPIIPAESWKPYGDQNPLPLILGLLATTIGLPFLLLSSATPLLQSWIASAQTTAPSYSIYRLYALSNLGSMLALLSYPLLVEPSLPANDQVWIWSAGYLTFAFLYLAIVWRYRATITPLSDQPSTRAMEDPRPARADRLFWFLLSFAGSVLLLAVTNQVLRNVAPIPLFWMVPLALYLLSFVICFEHPRWYHRPLWLPLAAIGAMYTTYMVGQTILTTRPLVPLVLWLLSLFFFCMACHGELARSKPASRSITSYYLTIATGGAAGGLFVSGLAPFIFPADFDLALILPFVMSLLLAVLWRHRSATWSPHIVGAALVSMLLVMTAFVWPMLDREYVRLTDAVFLERNFYGPLLVQDRGDMRQLLNGTILHGSEYRSEHTSEFSGRPEEPVSYYAKTSGIGIVLTELGRNGPLKVGAIGLGTGTLAAYARPGDSYRFYEINPAVPNIAKTYFHYLDACTSACDIVLGDARLSLEREEPQAFDLLAVDAFTSDSIPVHLLTREAFALYWRHLKPGGILAIHTTNTYVTLAPIVALAAERDGKKAHLFADAKRGDAVERTQWILVPADEGLFNQGPLSYGLPVSVPGALRPWTDDYTSIWQSLR